MPEGKSPISLYTSGRDLGFLKIGRVLESAREAVWRDCFGDLFFGLSVADGNTLVNTLVLDEDLSRISSKC